MSEKLIGGCNCGRIRYRLTQQPLIVHCCHCSWCQRETGAAFAVNALVETSSVINEGDQVVLIDTPSESGKGQKIARCPECQVAVWSHYAGFGENVSFIRVGTLDQPTQTPPDVHIFTESKQPWFQLPADTPSFGKYYSTRQVWSEESMLRLKKLRPTQ
ncbi:MAG: GFA family protein [Marinicella sp.]|nr:GFA family protein [Xanthomonadales bacterium]